MDIEKEQRKNKRAVDTVLDMFYWPPSLTTSKSYITTHDDNDGDPCSGVLQVQFSVDGDAWISINGKALRFRTGFGGGRFQKIRNAILVLAEAIRQEGEFPIKDDLDSID